MEATMPLRRTDPVSAWSGAAIFTVMGALWTAFGVYSSPKRDALWIGVAAGLIVLCLAGALALRKPKTPEATDPASIARREREGRAFGIVNAVQGVAIFLAVQVCANLRAPQYLPVAVAAIVGLHFVALEPLYRSCFHGGLGALLCLLAAGVALLAPSPLWGCLIGLGCGALLWTSAALRLRLAARG